MDRPKVKEYCRPDRIEDYPAWPTFAAGHLVETNAGWRTFRPVIDYEKCVRCLRCFLLCPDGVIDKSGENVEIDYDFCKGCGICAQECPVNAISMEKEAV